MSQESESRLSRLCSLLERLVSRLTGDDAETEGEDANGSEAQYERAGRSEYSQPDLLGTEVIGDPEDGGEGNINPAAARDALVELRRIKAVVAGSGDRRAIDSYNRAIASVKHQIQLRNDATISAGRQGSRFSCDARVGRVRGVDRRSDDASSFEAAAARMHRRDRAEVEPVSTEAVHVQRYAEDEFDPSPEGQSQFFADSATRMRDEMLHKKPRW